jgi:hypothetical protein
MKVICSCKTSADSEWTTGRYVPKDGTFQFWRYFKSRTPKLTTVHQNCHSVLMVPHYSYLVFFLVSLGGVRLSPLGTSATVGRLYQPRMIDDDYGAVSGNLSTRRKPAPVPLCPPQIPHDLTSNPGCHGGKPATNRLSYGTAYSYLRQKAS